MAAPLPPEVLAALGRMFEENPDAIRLVGPDGAAILRNPAARALPAEGLGHLCDPARRGADPSCPSCAVARAFREGLHRRWHVVVPGGEESGPPRYWEVTICPVPGDAGEISAVVEILRDATVTLSLEQHLIRTAESQEDEIRRRSLEAGQLLEAAESLRSQLGTLQDSQAEIVCRDRLVALGLLVAGLAHEIRTPLGAVLSSADLLVRQVARLREALPSEGEGEAARRLLEGARSSAEIVAEGARRIRTVFRSLQVFSRVDEAPRKEVDLHESLDSTLEVLRHRIEGGVRVVRDYGDLPPVTCRPDALNQVFLNLLVNAVQAVPDGGEIRIRTRSAEGGVEVEVADDGVGIPPEVLPRIFDLGFSTRGPGRGMGIGLALCRWIVEEHSGRIEVRSEPGKGTSVVVLLPALPPEKG